MGIFDKFKDFQANRRRKKIEKSRRIVKNAKAVKEDRMAALHFLSEIEDMNEAVPALLSRFDYSLENGITDTREKDVAFQGVVRWGEECLPLLTEHLQKTTRIAWPIKILNQIASPEVVATTLIEVLNFDAASFDNAAIDKNFDVLCYLRDFKLPNISERLAHFLNDADERVRFACVEALIEQDEPGVPTLLERFISDESSENRRLRKATIDAFVEKRWQIGEPEAIQHELVAEGVFFNKKSKTLESRVR